MTRSETTEALTALAEARMRRRCRLWAPEVEVTGGGRVDLMGFSPYGERPDAAAIERGLLTCMEVKSCMADFTSGHGLNFVGDVNWLVCTRELLAELRDEGMAPSFAGVLCPDASWGRLVEAAPQPPEPCRWRRKMAAAEAIWRIAKESYGARYEREIGGF